MDDMTGKTEELLERYMNHLETRGVDGRIIVEFMNELLAIGGYPELEFKYTDEDGHMPTEYLIKPDIPSESRAEPTSPIPDSEGYYNQLLLDELLATYKQRERELETLLKEKDRTINKLLDYVGKSKEND